MRAVIAYIVSILIFVGCGNSASENILPLECRDFQRALEDESIDIGHHFTAAFESLRDELTNIQ